MSDEQFMESGLPPLETTKEVSTDTDEYVEAVEEDTESAAEGEADEEASVSEEVVDAENETTEVDTESEEETDEADDSEESVEEEKSVIDYESEYKKILAPFKANGKEIQIESVDDAVQLMQMGANYNKKMAALKPNLKLLKMLENNSLLTEEKLSYLIDLDRKDPDAIKKLVKDSKIDTYELENSDDASEYKPKTYTVDDSELALDAVLEDISSTPTYSTTVDVIGTKWDEASRKDIVKNPEIIRVINEHISNGIYELISTETEKEKMLGRLSGMTDIEAYRQVGDRLYAEGKFGAATPQAESSKSIETPTKTRAKTTDPKVVERKRAAAPTKSNPSASSPTEDFNPLNLSDEEFEKQFSSKYT